MTQLENEVFWADCEPWYESRRKKLPFSWVWPVVVVICSVTIGLLCILWEVYVHQAG